MGTDDARQWFDGRVHEVRILFEASQASLNGGEGRVDEFVRDAGPDRVEVNLGHARGNRGIVEQGLALEAALPEAAGASILRVGFTRDALVEEAHEPAQAAKSRSKLGEALGLREYVADALLDVAFLNGLEPAIEPRSTASHVFVRSGCGQSGINLQDHVGVIAHHSPCIQADGETVGEDEQALLDPGAVMVEATAGDGIITAEPGATDAPAHAVIEARVVLVDCEGAWVAHAESIRRSVGLRCGRLLALL